MRTIHGGDVWQGGAPEEYLDFSANLNPEGPPDWVRAAMAEGVARAAYYPDIRGRAALAGLSAHLDLPEDCLLPTNGGIEAAALAAGLAQGRGNLIAQPTFQEYGRLCGDWTSIPRERLMAPPFQGETIWVCNPNNPTGHAFSRTEMTALLSGRDNRLVSRKYFGKVWKRNQTSGAVKTWQDRVRAVAFQIRRIGSARSSRVCGAGYQACNRGSRIVMPSIAR